MEASVVLAREIAGKVGARVIIYFAVSYMVDLCANSACLLPLASHCNVAMHIAYGALGQVTLTIKTCAVFQLIVVKETFLYKSIGFIWGSYFYQEKVVLPAIYKYFFSS